MNNSQRYAEILRQVFQGIASQHVHGKGLQVRSICDEVSGQFLIVATGWDRSAERVALHDSIMVDVFIRDDKVVFIENDIEKRPPSDPCKNCAEFPQRSLISGV